MRIRPDRDRRASCTADVVLRKSRVHRHASLRADASDQAAHPCATQACKLNGRNRGALLRTPLLELAAFYHISVNLGKRNPRKNAEFLKI